MKDIYALKNFIGQAAISLRMHNPDVIPLAADLVKAIDTIAPALPSKSDVMDPLYEVLIKDPALAKRAGVSVQSYPAATLGDDENAFASRVAEHAKEHNKPSVAIHIDGDNAHIIAFAEGPNLIREATKSYMKYMQNHR